MDLYKKKSFRLLGTDAAREARSNVRKSVREQSRYERFSLLRDMLSILESPEAPRKERPLLLQTEISNKPLDVEDEVFKKPSGVQKELFKKPISCAPVTGSSKQLASFPHKQISGIPKPPAASKSRLDMLKKWREEKGLKKQLEMRSTKSAFKVPASSMKAPSNSQRQESLSQSRLQASQKSYSKVPSQVQKPQFKKDPVVNKTQSKVINSAVPSSKPPTKATNSISAPAKPPAKAMNSVSAPAKPPVKATNSVLAPAKPPVKATNSVSAPAKSQIKSSTLPAAKYHSKSNAQSASTIVQNKQVPAPSKNLYSQNGNIFPQNKCTRSVPSQIKSTGIQSRSVPSQIKSTSNLSKNMSSQSVQGKNKNSDNLTIKSQVKTSSNSTSVQQRSLARGVPKLSSMKIPNKSAEQKISTNDNRNIQSKMSFKPQIAVSSKTNIKAEGKVPIPRQNQGAAKLLTSSKCVGKTIQKTDTGQSLASSGDSSLESHSRSGNNESKSFAPKDFVFKPLLFNSSVGCEIDFLAVLNRVEAEKKNRTSTPIRDSYARDDVTGSEKNTDSQPNCGNLKLETLESTSPQRSIITGSTPSKETSEMEAFPSKSDPPSDLKLVVPDIISIPTECKPEGSDSSVVVEALDFDSSGKTESFTMKIPEIAPIDAVQLHEPEIVPSAGVSVFLVKDEIKAAKTSCQTSEKCEDSDRIEEITNAVTKVNKTPKTRVGQEQFSRPVTRSVTRKSLATLNSGGMVRQTVAETPIGPTPVKPRTRSIAEGLSPRRSLRLMRKSIHNSLELLMDEQEPSFVDSPENVAPQNAATSCLAQDFRKMKLDSLAEDIDFSNSISVRQPKVSLLYTPPRTRKSIRQSVRGDLMCFSPGI